MDKLSRETRSALMSRIKSKDTQPEMTVRHLVHAMGRRYRLHVGSLPGCPDLVFPRDKKLIFVHGCFWHQHARCPRAKPPRSRGEYWTKKLERNRMRDARNVSALRRQGWRVLTIRECQLLQIDRVERRLEKFLGAASPRRH